MQSGEWKMFHKGKLVREHPPVLSTANAIYYRQPEGRAAC